VSHIVKELLGVDVDVDHRNRMEMNGIFTWELGKGEHSCVFFKKDDVELAQLVYNPKYTDKEKDNISMENLVVPTVPQKPDIVLQLKKYDLQKDMKLTYLFDAKYQIEGRINGVDTPPEDAINQMHRYRDAIYYKEYSSKELKKEIIGGYILFPGDGQKTDVEVSKFYKTIEEVNIGAFPLRPKEVENRELLVKFIESLIGKASIDILNNSIPQKGLYYSVDEPKDAVYMTLALDKNVNKDMAAIVSGQADTIIMGRLGIDETKDIGAIRYIAPIIPGKHIEGYYKVAKANLINVDDEKYSVRIRFVVYDWVKLEHSVRHGAFPIVFRGLCRSRDEFFRYCKDKAIMDR
jgi:hypothetical protein